MSNPSNAAPSAPLSSPVQIQQVHGATIGALIDSGAACLTAAQVGFGHGTTNAYDEAAWLVLWSLGLPLDSPLDDESADSVRNQPLSQAQQARAATFFEQRIATCQPAAYLTREAWLQELATATLK